jgi:hypothetical protein
MEEATRPRARGSEPMSMRCQERAYARRVYGALLDMYWGRYGVAEIRWGMYLAYDLRHDVLWGQWPGLQLLIAFLSVSGRPWVYDDVSGEQCCSLRLPYRERWVMPSPSAQFPERDGHVEIRSAIGGDSEVK